MSDGPAWLPAAQVGAAVLSPVIAAITAILTLRWKDRDALIGSVDWVFDYDNERGEIQFPFLMVQNRSQHAVHVTSLEFKRGVLFRRSDGNTALEYDDPLDLNFPYEIEPGKTRRFYLDERHASRTLGEIRLVDRVANMVGRKPFVVVARTMSGSTKHFDAVRAVPYGNRPSWAQ